MKANYGFKDGTGEFFITIDTDRCTACDDCIPACPQGMFEMFEDEIYDEKYAVVKEDKRKKLKFECNVCKPAAGYQMADLPCIRVCEPGAIEHSW
jgi:NAD-dependent dihydropyrimidine dehydrogenase PreA subunit